MEFLKFPKIFKFKDSLKEMRKQELAEVKFKILPKMHGTNACVAFKDGELIHCQSRNRILSILKDNAGFAAFVHRNKDDLEKSFKDDGEYYIYGEWIGPNTIAGAAVGDLDQRYFVAFKKFKEGEWFDVDVKSTNDCIRSINEFFPNLEYTVKISKRNEVYDELVKIMDAVERECPVAKGLEGVEGGIGEGIVGTCKDSSLWFKLRGTRHKGHSDKRTLEDTDYEAICEADDFMQEFFDEHRLMQGVEYLKEMMFDPEDIKSTGYYIQWGHKEFEEEGLSEYMERGLDPKFAKRSASKKLGSWFTQRLDYL